MELDRTSRAVPEEMKVWENEMKFEKLSLPRNRDLIMRDFFLSKHYAGGHIILSDMREQTLRLVECISGIAYDLNI